MFSGGDYDEVARWLENFVASHAKREDVRIEAVVDAEAHHPVSYGVRLRLGEHLHPASDHPPVEIVFDDAARNRGALAWCAALAERVRGLARDLSQRVRAERRSA
ncbi:MAG TPA: hypothetical protein VEL75_11595 [Candidatus Methylomirabilis sp.]|nr:hypothetical protein [Candidatus Methylomirabilis sp.]